MISHGSSIFFSPGIDRNEPGNWTIGQRKPQINICIVLDKEKAVEYLIYGYIYPPYGNRSQKMRRGKNSLGYTGF